MMFSLRPDQAKFLRCFESADAALKELCLWWLITLVMCPLGDLLIEKCVVRANEMQFEGYFVYSVM